MHKEKETPCDSGNRNSSRERVTHLPFSASSILSSCWPPCPLGICPPSARSHDHTCHKSGRINTGTFIWECLSSKEPYRLSGGKKMIYNPNKNRREHLGYNVADQKLYGIMCNYLSSHLKTTDPVQGCRRKRLYSLFFVCWYFY